MIQRICALAAALVLAAALAGCGTDGPAPSSEAPAASAPSFPPGRVEGNAYRSEALGLGAAFDGTWVIYNLTDPTDEHFMAVDKSSVTFDLVAMREDPFASVKVVFEPAGDAPLDDYVDGKVPALSNQLTQSGFQDVVVTHREQSVAGRSYPCLTATMRTDETAYVEAIAFLPCGEWIAQIIVFAPDSASVDAVFALFSA